MSPGRPIGSLSVQTNAIIDLHNQGLRPMHISERLGIRPGTVHTTLYRLTRQKLITRWVREKTQQAEDAADDTSGERCRCGLRLPCNNCVRSAVEFAQQRREHWSDTGGERTSYPAKRKRAA